MERFQNRKKLILKIAFLVLVSIYFPLKYNDTFEWIIRSSRLTEGLRWLYLPMGLSFYGFKAAAYIFDVYYGKSQPEKSLEKLMLYIGFFPQIISGPFMGPDEFFKQLESVKPYDENEVLSGLGLVSLGFFKKTVFATALAGCIHEALVHPKLVSAVEWIVIGALTRLYIYYDFSGYSEVSNGISLTFGIKVQKNFDQPFKSKNIVEFWRRWHISLSKWLRDYVYFPLVTRSTSFFGVYVCILISFTCLGLWHGDRLHFILYGLLNGVGVATSTFLSRRRSEANRVISPPGPFSIACFYIFLVFLPCPLLLLHDNLAFYDYLSSFLKVKSWFRFDYFFNGSASPLNLLIVPFCVLFEWISVFYGAAIWRTYNEMNKLTRSICVLIGFFLSYSLISYSIDYRFFYQKF